MRQDVIHSRNGAQAAASAAGKNLFFTTLVVNNHFPLDGVIESFLKSEGHSMLTAGTPQEALAKIRQFQPDLILLDSELDGVNGLALLPELLFEQVSAAVIILASKPSVSDAAESIKLGAVDYFERPLDPEKLKRIIDIQKALFNG
jgi:DNA-binding response OmpR family regulator